MNKSVWQKKSRPNYAKIAAGQRKNSRFDVVIIGGGITGLASAYFLKQAGAKVCVLERGRLGSGDTGHTTAHLNSFIDVRVSDLVQNFGEDDAARVLQAGQAAIDAIERIVDHEGLACEFRRVDGYLHAPLLSRSVSELEIARFRKDAALAAHLGVDCHFVSEVPGVAKPGICFKNQALFHPLEFLAGLAQAVHGDGSAVFEHSEVKTVESDPLHVTGKGFNVECSQVVIATHVPLAGKTNLLSATLFQTKLAPYSTYVIGAKILSGSLPEACASDTSDPYYYWRVDRRANDDYLIFGGRDHKTGQVQHPEQRFSQLEKDLHKLAPEAVIDHHWSGQVIETHDGLPFIGEMNGGQFIATGYNGNGITFGVTAGLMARDVFLNQTNPWTKLFSPHRVEVRSDSLKDYFKENIDYPVYMLKQRLKKPEIDTPESLAKGQAAVLKVEGQRIACARDDDGTLHKVSAVCTHMGCLVEWNGAERTWDCPCHGSRFTPSGKVVAGPAEVALAPFKEEKKPEPKRAAVRRAASAKASVRATKKS